MLNDVQRVLCHRDWDSKPYSPAQALERRISIAVNLKRDHIYFCGVWHHVSRVNDLLQKLKEVANA